VKDDNEIHLDTFPYVTKNGIKTFARDVMFYAFHQSKVQEGKSCLTDNAHDFLSTIYPDCDTSVETLKVQYYSMIKEIPK